MADFSTGITTPDAEPSPSLATIGLSSLRQGLSYVQEMKAQTTPSTPALGGSSGPRPTLGLIFPRGM